MSDPKWRPLRGVDQGALHEARLQAHYAAQALARFARAYVPPQSDDGHTSLGWDDSRNGFTTQPAANGTRLSLNIADLTLAVDGGKSLALNGRTEAQARQWLGSELSALGLDPAALDAPSPYEMPAHAIAQGASYEAAGTGQGLTELAAWYSNANLSIGAVGNKMMQGATSPLCCWPHHFDLAVLTTLKRGTNPDGYLGVGLSPGDPYYDEPYFYVSVYPKPDDALLPTLPMIGHWHTHEFVAALSPAHKIVVQDDQQAAAEQFLRHSVAAALEVLA
jgi:hypothetical protein